MLLVRYSSKTHLLTILTNSIHWTYNLTHTFSLLIAITKITAGMCNTCHAMCVPCSTPGWYPWYPENGSKQGVTTHCIRKDWITCVHCWRQVISRLFVAVYVGIQNTAIIHGLHVRSITCVIAFDAHYADNAGVLDLSSCVLWMSSMLLSR